MTGIPIFTAKQFSLLAWPFRPGPFTPKKDQLFLRLCECALTLFSAFCKGGVQNRIFSPRLCTLTGGIRSVVFLKERYEPGECNDVLTEAELRRIRNKTPKPVICRLPVVPTTGFLRLTQIIGDSEADPPLPALIPVAASTWWLWVRQGRVPKPIKLSRSITVWPVEGILSLIKRINECQGFHDADSAEN